MLIEWDAVPEADRYEVSYSTDGRKFTPFGEVYQLEWGYYRGSRIGIYCFNNIADAGYIDVDEFIYLY